MRKTILAFLAAIAITIPGLAIAAEGDATPEAPQAATTTPAPPPPCTPAKEIYALKRWHRAHPAKGHRVCEIPKRRADKIQERFFRWREYRRITPYTGCSGGGRWLRFTAVPGYVVSHESGCSWTAENPDSGACGPYQLNGWTSCATGTFEDKMRHHRMAAYVLAHQGLAAAWTNNW